MDLDSILNLVLAILGVGFLIFVHELGHFLAAKRVGVRVDTFAIGFQPTIFGFRARFCAFTWGDTEYVIGMVPFGGYVRMAGEEVSDEKTGASDEFSSKKPSERALVLVAGSAMNLIFGFLFFIWAYSMGVSTPLPTVGMVAEDSPAYRAGLQVGDQVLSIDGEKITEFLEVFVKAAFGKSGESLAFEIERDSKIRTLEVTPEYNPTRGMLGIGIGKAGTMTIDSVQKGSAAEQAGLQNGDKITQLELSNLGEKWTLPDSIPVAIRFQTLAGFMNFNSSVKADFEVLRGEEKLNFSVQATPNKVGDPGVVQRTGARFERRIVRHVSPSSGAAKHFKPGMEIATIQGTPVFGLDMEVLRKYSKGPTTRVGVSSGENFEVATDQLYRWLATQELAIATSINPATDEGDQTEVDPASSMIIAYVEPASPAENAGMRVGDKVVSVNGKEVHNLKEYRELVVSKDDAPRELAIRILRDKKEITLQVTPAAIGSKFGFGVLEASFILKGDLWTATKLGYDKTLLWASRVFISLRSLINRDTSPKNLSGPVGIIAVTKLTASQGFSKLIWFLAMISVNLGIFNLLPFPILDGGHLGFLLIEKIKGSPVSDTVLHYVHLVAFILLISMALFVTYNDLHQYVFNG